MKSITPLLMATILLFALLGTAAAQSDDEQPTVEATQGEWGMRIIFAPGTTITEANALRLAHNLQLQPTGSVSDDGRHFTYRYTDDRNYAGFAQFYWSDTDHEGYFADDTEQPCPAIEPRYGYYAPVASLVADQLRQDPRVAQVDNQDDPAYAQMDETRILTEMSHYWETQTNGATGPMA